MINKLGFITRSTLAVSCSVLLLGGLGGCAPLMSALGPGGNVHAQILGDTHKPIAVSRVTVKNLIPAGGDGISPEAVSKYEATISAPKIAELSIIETGYGDKEQKGIDKLKVRAAKLGANLVVIVSEENTTAGALGKITGTDSVKIDALAYRVKE